MVRFNKNVIKKLYKINNNFGTHREVGIFLTCIYNHKMYSSL